MSVVHGFLAGDGRIGLWAEGTGPARSTPPLAHPWAAPPPLAGDAGEATEFTEYWIQNRDARRRAQDEMKQKAIDEAKAGTAA